MQPKHHTPQRDDDPIAQPSKPDPKTGLDVEIGDLDVADAEDEVHCQDA